ncbi:hypothetical protein [Spongiimicrobium sp. 3-5]|uniref:hypothetical protein n=1 Tax=Spongiimicrobium sp. 3-5 TaxID=3332596 RepID=UPI0039801A63
MIGKGNGNSNRFKSQELHMELQQWKSHLCLIDDEITFIDRLLNSYVFEPNTPNLFERLQEYQQRLTATKGKKAKVGGLLAKHQNDLGGILECSDNGCNLWYQKKHETLKTKVKKCLDDFQGLKSEIFNYAGGILKKRKSDT